MKNRLTTYSVLLTSVFLFIVIEACRKSDLFKNTTPVSFNIPQGFPPTVYNFQEHPLNQQAITLGRQLFYEGRLAKDGSTSCGSCHNQIAAFTSYDHDLSHGYNNSHTRRNAPVLFNLAWYKEFQLDGGRNSLESITLKHINSLVDMGGTMTDAVPRIETDTLYKRLFREAYGSERVTSQRLLKALTQFMVQMVSTNAKYDKVKKGEAIFTPNEQIGYQVFQINCSTCHKEPLFTDFSYRNIGLTMDNHLEDKGRMEVTGNRSDSLKFRVPTLRNIMASSYYAHDGRFPLVRNVINHYRTGIVPSSTLDPLLTNGIDLTDADVDYLISFLRTLTDSTLLTNPNYSQP